MKEIVEEAGRRYALGCEEGLIAVSDYKDMAEVLGRLCYIVAEESGQENAFLETAPNASACPRAFLTWSALA